MAEWIPITKRLPPKGETVIGYDTWYERVGEAYLCGWNERRIVFVDNDDCFITHWMPFPEPPTGAEILTKEEVAKFLG